MDDFLKTVENLQIDPKSHLGLLIGIAVVILSISEYWIFQIIHLLFSFNLKFLNSYLLAPETIIKQKEPGIASRCIEFRQNYSFLPVGPQKNSFHADFHYSKFGHCCFPEGSINKRKKG